MKYLFFALAMLATVCSQAQVFVGDKVYEYENNVEFDLETFKVGVVYKITPITHQAFINKKKSVGGVEKQRVDMDDFPMSPTIFIIASAKEGPYDSYNPECLVYIEGDGSKSQFFSQRVKELFAASSKSQNDEKILIDSVKSLMHLSSNHNSSGTLSLTDVLSLIKTVDGELYINVISSYSEANWVVQENYTMPVNMVVVQEPVKLE